MKKIKGTVDEVDIILDDESKVSVQSLDPAIHASQNPELTTETESHDISLTDSQEVSLVGRRRGRRQIMKKKMAKDEEGYLGGRHQ